MRNSKIPVIFSSLFILFLLFTDSFAIVGNDIPGETENEFELHNGDRVVFLGNSLIQYDQQYGYMEYVLTTKWPQRDITFRNLGWAGDTIHGDARTYYTTPPNSYELLIKQLKEVRPAVVFIGYGANEAYEGEDGVSRFRQGLNKLLDEIEKMDATAILLSPIPQMSRLIPEQKLAMRNKNLRLYSSAISEVASKRDIRYINLFEPFQKLENGHQLTTDGIHLNQSGYYYLASVIEGGLGFPSRKWEVEIDRSKQLVEAKGKATILESQFTRNNITFTLDNAILPLPPPGTTAAPQIHTRDFRIHGLDDGCYTLSAGTANVVSASAKRWSNGIQIKQGVLFRQAKELRELIVKKNQLFFRKYRPTNRTYLVGFRSYEQGQNSKELEQLDLFISRLEDQISQLRKPHPEVYRVDVVK